MTYDTSTRCCQRLRHRVPKTWKPLLTYYSTLLITVQSHIRKVITYVHTYIRTYVITDQLTSILTPLLPTCRPRKATIFIFIFTLTLSCTPSSFLLPPSYRPLIFRPNRLTAIIHHIIMNNQAWTIPLHVVRGCGAVLKKTEQVPSSPIVTHPLRRDQLNFHDQTLPEEKTVVTSPSSSC